MSRPTMETTSKELLDLPTKPSILETLLLGSKDPPPKPQKNKHRADEDLKGRPITTALPTSHVLGKVKDFLGVMAKANEKLELDSQENSRSNYDIEVLDGNEQEHIEMDLLLGVADLHNAEAVAAAEASMSRFQQSIASPGSSCSDSEDDSDDDADDDNDDNDETTACPTDKFKKPKSDKDESLPNDKTNKRPKIVVLD